MSKAALVEGMWLVTGAAAADFVFTSLTFDRYRSFFPAFHNATFFYLHVESMVERSVV